MPTVTAKHQTDFSGIYPRYIVSFTDSMQSLLNRLTSPLSRVQLSLPLASQENNETTTSSQTLSESLKIAGCNRLNDVFRQVEERPRSLALQRDNGDVDIHHQYLRNQINSFFSTRSLTHFTSVNGGRRSKPLGCSIQVRKIGEVASPPHSHETELFWTSCSIPLSGEHANLAAIHWERRPEEVQGEPLTTIPASANLTPLEASSLAVPIRQSTYEFIFSGQAGAIVSFSPNTFAITAELTWSPEAYVGSLNALQEIGKWLIAARSIERAVETGMGTQEVRGCSALLSKVYEIAAQVGQTHWQPFLVSGLWGIAVLPRPQQSYDHLVQVGVVGLKIQEDDIHDLSKITLVQDRTMAVVNVHLSRNDFGFVTTTADKVSTFPLQHIEWHTTLPRIER